MVITMTYDDLQPHFSKAFSEAQRDAQIDGFRKGKAPLAMVKQRFGAAIERQALPDIAQSVFAEEIQRQEIPVSGIPMMKKSTRTDDKGAEFVIYYEVSPTIELQDFSSIVVTKPVKEFTEDDIDGEVYRLRLRISTLEPADVISDALHVVKLKFSDIDSATNMPLLGGKERELFLEDPNVDPILRNDCLNLRRGDSFRYTEEHAAGEHGDHAHTHDYLVSVTDIQKVVLPELNEQFVKKLTEGNLSSIEELRTNIRMDMMYRFNQDVVKSLDNEIRMKVVELHEFDVPASLVVRVAQEMVAEVREKNKNDQQLKRIPDEQLVRFYLPQAEKQVRWEFIVDAIVKRDNIVVTDDDLNEVAQSVNMTVEQIREYFQDEQQQMQILEMKVSRMLLDTVTIEERPLDDFLDELEARAEAEEQEQEELLSDDNDKLS